MSGHDFSVVNANLVRTELWSDNLKDILVDILQGTKYVNWMTNFPDGTTFTIPSIGQMPMREVSESDAVVYDVLDTGEFQFTINHYVEAATFITDKAKQDSYYADQLIAAFLPKMRRAIEENLETNVLALANSQTAADPNSINNAAHRIAASGNSNTTLTVSDFAKMKFALDKANASQMRVAIIDPSQEYYLNTLTNLVNVINNPMFEGIITEGFVNSQTGMKFSKNIFGFDVYVSNYLPTPTGATVDGSIAMPTTPKANIFMSFGGDETPFKGAWRQMLNVETERNKDLRRDEYVMNGRYGLKLYRPETLAVAVSRGTIA